MEPEGWRGGETLSGSQFRCVFSTWPQTPPNPTVGFRGTKFARLALEQRGTVMELRLGQQEQRCEGSHLAWLSSKSIVNNRAG